jgi:hypothetical protein
VTSTILAKAPGGHGLDNEDHHRRKRKGRSASGEVDGPIVEPKATIFEEVKAEEDASLEEFEPVPHNEPAVEWDDGEDWEVVEERWEALLEDLFTDFEDQEDMNAFEEVIENLGWSSGEVIWEGMDFDQMFTDSGEFHAFELLSRKDQRAFLRDRLRTQQASDVAEAGDGEIDLDTDRRSDPGHTKPVPKKATDGKGSGSLVSYETETEHRPEDLDIAIATGKGKRRRHT